MMIQEQILWTIKVCSHRCVGIAVEEALSIPIIEQIRIQEVEMLDTGYNKVQTYLIKEGIQMVAQEAQEH